MTFPSNATGIYCPGCSAGDFPQPHICGVQNQPPFLSAFQIVPPAPPPPCDHCFCLKQKQGSYRIPDNYMGSYYHLKPHHVCCMCLTRRLKHPGA